MSNASKAEIREMVRKNCNKHVSKPDEGITEEKPKGSTETEADRSVERNTQNKSGNLSENEGLNIPRQ